MKTAEISMGLDQKTHNKLLVAERIQATTRTYALARGEDPKTAASAMKKLVDLLANTPGAIDIFNEIENRGRERVSKGGV